MLNSVAKQGFSTCTILVIAFSLVGFTPIAASSRGSNPKNAHWNLVSPLLVTHENTRHATYDEELYTTSISRNTLMSSHTMSTRHLQTSYEDLSCNVFNDDCPTTGDRVCDRPTCTLDCMDCDECNQFHADCELCAKHNCYWCPGDAICRNSNQYISIYIVGSCQAPGDYLQGQDNKCLAQEQLFNDPLYEAQAWVYKMIRLEDVWEMGYTGLGVRVRINDNGVEASHSEFQGRFNVTASCQDYLSLSSSASSSGGGAEHGTHVAGIVGAAANNGRCSIGIAPEVTLSSCNIFSDTDPYAHLASLDYDIANQSFGDVPCAPVAVRKLQQLVEITIPTTCPFIFRDDRVVHPCDVCKTFSSPTADCQFAVVKHCSLFWKLDHDACLDLVHLLVDDGQCYFTLFPAAVQTGLERAILEGRDGKGIIFITAVGNSYTSGGYATTIGYGQSRFTILVGAVDKLSGQHASYSVPGPALFVSAPGGDSSSLANHVTASLNDKCEDAGIGTSYACPVVSGVVALLLQARPDLTWRDVQGILAISSQSVVDDYDTTSITNSAGYWHSDYYGFGVVDALAAVRSALAWTLLPEESILVVESETINAALVDDASITTTSTLVLEEVSSSGSHEFFTESVQALIQLEYIARGHLRIVLVSPSGIRSLLHPGGLPEYTQEADDRYWVLLSLKTWGENPMGNWTLELNDSKFGDVPSETQCIDAAWYFQQTDSSELTCLLLEEIGACRDGLLNPDGFLESDEMDRLMSIEYDGGVLPTEACCACGGDGVTRGNVKNQLHRWVLVVHGHWKEGDGDSNSRPSRTPSPSASPSAVLSNRPTVTPTRQLNDMPTENSGLEFDPDSEAPMMASSTTPSVTDAPSDPPVSPPDEDPATSGEPFRSGVSRMIMMTIQGVFVWCLQYLS